jgi:hypothetical protein
LPHYPLLLNDPHHDEACFLSGKFAIEKQKMKPVHSSSREILVLLRTVSAELKAEAVNCQP